jgi:hypothetical protein
MARPPLSQLQTIDASGNRTLAFKKGPLQTRSEGYFGSARIQQLSW